MENDGAILTTFQTKLVIIRQHFVVQHHFDHLPIRNHVELMLGQSRPTDRLPKVNLEVENVILYFEMAHKYSRCKQIT